MTPDHIVESIRNIVETIAPYGVWIITLLFTALELRLYLKARALYQSWDGEDEEIIETAEEKLSWVLMFSSTNSVINFFFFGVSNVITSEQIIPSIMLLAGFIAGIVEILIIQQKTVDLTKKINPEKKGSVYDSKFSKKWIESCDENEQRQIGQSAFKAYTAVIYTCVILWVILVFFSITFEIGILPILIVSLIWGIAQIVYCYESIRLTKH